MHTQVLINGENFLPLKEAAEVVSYSRDYVARLARDKKIVATQVGRQWFVDLVSLKNFSETAQMEQSVRKQQLSEERKREQLVKAETGEVKLEVAQKIKSVHLHAQMVAMLVLSFGLLTGAGIYTTANLFSNQAANISSLSETSPLVAESVIPKAVSETSDFAVAEPQVTTMFNNVVEYPVFIDESETRAMSVGNSEGILLLGRNGEVRSAEELAAMFSDDVRVEFVDDSTGVVVYTTSKGEEVEYPFVSVPSRGRSQVIAEVI